MLPSPGRGAIGIVEASTRARFIWLEVTLVPGRITVTRCHTDHVTPSDMSNVTGLGMSRLA